jgi:hypothetical protein
MTRHFSLEEWLDYVNRNVTAEKRAFMSHHLDSGCPHCAQIASQWQRLKQFSVAESRLEVPYDALAHVKEAFQPPRRAETRSLLEAIATLVFDSFRQPVLAGARSTLPSTRSLLYEAGPLLIDLNLDFAQSSEYVVLQGQVMDSQVQGRGVEEIPISLQSGQETIAETQTNEFGEFQLKCEMRKALQVSVAVNPRRNVLIILDDAVWGRQCFGAAS